MPANNLLDTPAAHKLEALRQLFPQAVEVDQVKARQDKLKPTLTLHAGQFQQCKEPWDNLTSSAS